MARITAKCSCFNACQYEEYSKGYTTGKELLPMAVL